MGATYATVIIKPLQDQGGYYQAEFLADTGAVDCLAPGSELEKIGIERVGRMTYELADGQRVELDFGLARIEVKGEITAGRVIFGPDDVVPILGVTALESTGFVVNPVTKSIDKLPAGLLK